MESLNCVSLLCCTHSAYSILKAHVTALRPLTPPVFAPLPPLPGPLPAHLVPCSGLCMVPERAFLHSGQSSVSWRLVFLKCHPCYSITCFLLLQTMLPQTLQVKTARGSYFVVPKGRKSKCGLAGSSTQGPPGLKSLWAGAMLLLWGSGAAGRTHTFASLRLRSPDHSVPSGRLGFFAMWSSGSSHGEACFLLGQPGCACLQRFENLTTCF